MFFENQLQNQKERYVNFLKIVGSLSNLFSENASPYLHYRIAEKIFCTSFDAEDLSRSDVSADAKKEDIGIGLKTFLENNGRTFQKIAEFNKARDLYHNEKPRRLIKTISGLRNRRIKATKDIHGIDSVYYHCVARAKNRFIIFEEEMKLISLDNIELDNNNSRKKIYFNDGIHEYSFDESKSTLLKRFNTPNNSIRIDIDILTNPLDELERFYRDNLGDDSITDNERECVVLPLYSTRRTKGAKTVPAKSGLNQWNAGGRARNNKEVYIPIPMSIHRLFPEFFPGRNTPFNLKLPNGTTMIAKVCQDNEKALMSNPNIDLGKWLLDDVLKIDEGCIVSYKDLETIGIDSVEVEKIDNDNYSINFKSIGSYELFLEDF